MIHFPQNAKPTNPLLSLLLIIPGISQPTYAANPHLEQEASAETSMATASPSASSSVSITQEKNRSFFEAYQEGGFNKINTLSNGNDNRILIEQTVEAKQIVVDRHSKPIGESQGIEPVVEDDSSAIENLQAGEQNEGVAIVEEESQELTISQEGTHLELEIEASVGPHNTTVSEQSGNNHVTVGQQLGTQNQYSHFPVGIRNTALDSQQGIGNIIRSVQYGYDDRTAASQWGSDNVMDLQQVGYGHIIDAIQQDEANNLIINQDDASLNPGVIERHE